MCVFGPQRDLYLFEAPRPIHALFLPQLYFQTHLYRRHGIRDRGEKYRGHTIRISGKERTFVECLDRVDYAGGWEETLKSLENFGGLDFKKIRDFVIQTDKQILVRKTGFVLELLKKRSMFYEHLPENTLEEIMKKVHGVPTYLIRNIGGPLNPNWRLYVPKGFEEKLRGV